MTLLNWIALGVLFILLLGFVIGALQLLKAPTEHELYGMTAEAYELTQIGDEEFIRLYGQEEYFRCVMELDALKKKRDEL